MNAQNFKKLKRNVDLAIIVNSVSAFHMIKKMKPYIDEHPELNNLYIETVVAFMNKRAGMADDREYMLTDLLFSHDKDIRETRYSIYGLLI